MICNMEQSPLQDPQNNELHPQQTHRNSNIEHIEFAIIKNTTISTILLMKDHSFKYIYHKKHKI